MPSAEAYSLRFRGDLFPTGKLCKWRFANRFAHAGVNEADDDGWVSRETNYFTLVPWSTRAMVRSGLR